MSDFAERALSFSLGADRLVGVLSMPRRPAARGVLIVVGGPQYRAGSHRQFTLLARHLAAQGVPVLRFDYRGMGDSEGARRAFEELDADIGCALDAFFAAVPALKEAVLWGLCDAASAALLYAPRDRRVAGLALVNPWVRSEEGLAQAYLRHYYLRRLLDGGLWRKLASGELRPWQSLRSLSRYARDAARGSSRAPRDFRARMLEGLRAFDGRVLLVLSGDDLTAQEFKRLVAASPDWQRLLAAARVTRRELPAANHTFARREWRDQLASWTEEWTRGF